MIPSVSKTIEPTSGVVTPAVFVHARFQIPVVPQRNLAGLESSSPMFGSMLIVAGVGVQVSPGFDTESSVIVPDCRK